MDKIFGWPPRALLSESRAAYWNNASVLHFRGTNYLKDVLYFLKICQGIYCCPYRRWRGHCALPVFNRSIPHAFGFFCCVGHFLLLLAAWCQLFLFWSSNQSQSPITVWRLSEGKRCNTVRKTKWTKTPPPKKKLQRKECNLIGYRAVTLMMHQPLKCTSCTVLPFTISISPGLPSTW